MNKQKIKILILITLILTLIAAYFGYSQANELVLTWLNINTKSNANIFDFVQLLINSGNQLPLVSKIKIIGAATIGIVITLLPIILLCLILFGSRKKEEIYGSASFAKPLDIKKAGLLPSKKQRSKFKYPAILIGKYLNKFLYFSGQQFIFLSAQTRSGKGVGFIVPNLLNYSDNAVVNDIKFENFKLTAGFRKSQGQEIFLFSPDGYADSEEARLAGEIKSHCYNPLYYIRRDMKFRDGDIQKIFNIIFPTQRDNPWNDLAANFAKGMTSYLLDLEACNELTKNDVNIPKLVELGGQKGGYVGVMTRAIQAHEDGEIKLSNACLSEFNKFLALHEEGQQSVLLSFYSEMGIYSNPTCKAAMSGNDFDFNDLRRKPMSIYVGLSPDGLKTYSKLINLFFSQLIMINTRVLPEQDKSLIYQLLLVLDELPALGKVDIIPDSIGYTAGYNVRYLIIVQNEAQLADLYGKEKAINIRNNCMIQMVYPSKEADAYTKQVSETLGYKTVRSKSTSYSYSGGKRSHSVSERIDRRALMLPQEIVDLGKINHKSGVSLKEIIIMEKVKPFIADKIIYFDEPLFAVRKNYSLNNIPEIPLLF